MIINLWSTPRTGSVWYSCYLRTQYTSSILLTEMFNRYHMNMYYSTSNGLTNHHTYVDGSFYKDYYMDNNQLMTRHVFNERVRTVDEEEAHVTSLLSNYTGTQTLIMHNHVAPINPAIRDILTDRASKNIYIYRKDKRKQLASYAIATSTRQFAVFDRTKLSTDIVPDIDIGPLENLINRIKIWDSIDKLNPIAYEDINFVDIPGLPLKQNIDHSLRLSNKMIDTIDKLVTEYENN